MVQLCKYKNIFGYPNQGIHKYKIFNLAIVDVFFTILGSMLLSYIINISLWITIPFMFLLGIVFHKIFCVDTTLNKLLFGHSTTQ